MYSNVRSDVSVVMNDADSDDDCVVIIAKSAFLNQATQSIDQKCDVVVWNLWKKRPNKTLVDFDDEDYLHMVCVGPGRVSECQKLAVDAVYTLEQTTQVVKIFCVD